ncbi:hypothetical protein [Amycolatopsis samaneae]|uniref:Uncharacterized protein n=1 Tax=Amycolatopsis samaneae TaxID=664691 RepID=A0ABW5GCY6_9PSEU
MTGERSDPTPIFDSVLTETGLDWPDPAARDRDAGDAAEPASPEKAK